MTKLVPKRRNKAAHASHGMSVVEGLGHFITCLSWLEAMDKGLMRPDMVRTLMHSAWYADALGIHHGWAERPNGNMARGKVFFYYLGDKIVSWEVPLDTEVPTDWGQFCGEEKYVAKRHRMTDDVRYSILDDYIQRTLADVKQMRAGG